MKSFFRRLLALLLCVGMLLCFSAVAFGEDEEIKDLNDRLDQLKKEEQALQAKVDAAKTEKAKQEAIKAKTTQEINIMKQQISLLEKKIADLELEIEEKEEEIFNLEDDIAETYDLFKRRMRAMYMSEHVSSLSLLLGAESFGDFLTTSEYLKRVAQHDQDIQTDLEQTLANVEAAKAAVEEAKAALEADQEELADTKAEAEETRRQLDAKLSATVAEIQSIEQMEKEFLADIAAKQKEMKETQEEIDRIYAEMEAMSEFVGGTFMLPVPGYASISSYYGWRFNGSDFHTGVDFTGKNVNGKSVVAANAGNVIFTKTTYIPNKSYGKYIIVDHGGGYSTLYAHLSSVNVSVGDYVEKGENIGNVGSTGWSTGPHLHFEVRINGKHTNPLPYLKG